MDHVIVSDAWRCGTCGRGLWLVFMPSGCDEDGHCDEALCEEVFCPGGHAVQAEIAEQVCDAADDELHDALEGGLHMGEVWQTPPETSRPPPRGAASRWATAPGVAFLAAAWVFVVGCIWSAFMPADGDPSAATVLVSFFGGSVVGLVFLRAAGRGGRPRRPSGR